ncbi:MAG: hypothetical protein KAV87_64780, partial [Desulfobacteraceae bacterium]|nr:hypothetical protein [Desulfobacteraceae bacterium]
ICVEEQDPISRVTSDNLIAQLSANSSTPLFRLVNKARGFATPDELEDSPRSVTDLGMIPFDMDVLNSFGTRSFWDEITHSLYRSALASVWNRLSAKLNLRVKLSPPRVSPMGNERLESRFGVLSWRDRIFFQYGLIIALIGFGYGLLGEDMFTSFMRDPIRTASMAMGIIGVAFAFSVFIKKQPKK